MGINSCESFSHDRLRSSRSDVGNLIFIVGLQFGSEAKGKIARYLAPMASIAVRTGAANAGHTIYHGKNSYTMRQLPCAWVNPGAELVIGVDAIISPDVLLGEIDRFEKILPIKDRLKIDGNAHVVIEDQIIDESNSDLAERIGSTSARSREGIGQAMADKVLRRARCLQIKNHPILKEYAVDTVEFINNSLEMGASVMVEGTQGFGLSNNHGIFPYTTGRDVTVSALAESIGVQQGYYQTDIYGVVRTFPIRVGGNSGPFAPGSREISWYEMRKITGKPNLPTELTSVTKIPRRIATFSDEQYVQACKVNRPTDICATFGDYLPYSKRMQFIEHLESLYPASVSLLSTGPRKIVDFDRYRAHKMKKVG